jgi:uncharacterized protein YcbX
MRVAELWRFPVKSMLGEQLDRSHVASAGLVGDRRYSIVDGVSGLGLTARRVPELLTAAARLVDDELEITLPDGSTLGADASDALSKWLGRDVKLVDARSSDGGYTYEYPTDLGTEQNWVSYDGAGAAFHDSGMWRVSMISTATLRDWDRRRFRANVLLDGAGEDDFVGHEVELGGAVVRVQTKIPRCVMVTRPQSGGIERDLDVLKTINAELESCIAVGGTVTTPGEVAVGDEVRAR